jgi:hypothetical protein
MMPNDDPIQKRFFNQISRSLPPSISMAGELCDLLNLGVDAVYRRINGSKLLNIHEVELICNHFETSFDVLCHSGKKIVPFEFSPIVDEKSFRNYLLSIIHALEKIRNSKSGRAIYAAEDIPLFYNFGFPALARFKVFYWKKSVLGDESLQHIKYDSTLVNEEILALGKELFDLYMYVHSIEI